MLESNRTYTLTICQRKQFAPKRRYTNGTEYNKTDLDKDIDDEWRRKKDGGDGKQIFTRGSSLDSDSVSYRISDSDGWDGDSYNKDKTDWGKSTNDTQYERDPSKSKAVKGYGKPSKGKYSADLGGFKTFGTEGQGNSQIGVKDTNDTKCGDRVMLVTVQAIQDTIESAAPPPPPPRSVQSSHPVVMAATSGMTLEFGNYEFVSTMNFGSGSQEQSGVHLKASLVSVALMALGLSSLA